MIRPGRPADLEAIVAIQQASPEAARWNPLDYFLYDLLVSEVAGRVTGFVVWRVTAPGEVEILNLAVSPEMRRQGTGRALLGAALDPRAEVFLEVRTSNQVARKFYTRLGFREVGTRPNYYHSPREDAVVMKLQP